jgi:hypothetical protein
VEGEISHVFDSLGVDFDQDIHQDTAARSSFFRIQGLETKRRKPVGSACYMTRKGKVRHRSGYFHDEVLRSYEKMAIVNPLEKYSPGNVSRTCLNRIKTLNIQERG